MDTGVRTATADLLPSILTLEAVDVAFAARVDDDSAAAVEQLVAERLGRRMRDVRSDLRGIAEDVTDPDLRSRLLDVLERIPVAPAEAGVPSVRLTRREREVLAEVARGRGNRQVGVRLGLTEQTVKSYLRSAMTKLNSSTRGEAVYRARNAGLLPD